MSRSASAADDASPISAAEANRLFDGFKSFPSLVLAVSGGPDSTALMVLAARWRGDAQLPRLVAVTIDHGLRKESKREAKAVGKLAQKLGIEHRTLQWTGRKPKTGLQETARLARYRLLAKVAREVDAGYVFTGHTLDDQAETILFRLARGSGISGLAGMHPISRIPLQERSDDIGLVRPLLKIPKSRLIATLKAARIPYADDPSNRDPLFTRSRLRKLMPTLAQEGLTASRLGLLADRALRVEAMIFDVLEHANARVVLNEPSDGPVTILDKDVFCALPVEIAIRVLGWTIKKAGSGRVELGKLEAFHEAMRQALAESAPFRRTLAGAVITLGGDRITVEPAPPRAARRKKHLTTRPIDRVSRSKRR